MITLGMAFLFGVDVGVGIISLVTWYILKKDKEEYVKMFKLKKDKKR